MIQKPGQALFVQLGHLQVGTVQCVVLCCTMWVISGCSFCVTSFFFHHQALYGPMATWLEFPYECSPRELEVVRIVCPLCTIKKKKMTYSVCFLCKHSIDADIIMHKMPTDQTGNQGQTGHVLQILEVCASPQELHILISKPRSLVQICIVELDVVVT